MPPTHVHLAGRDYHPERVHQPVPMATLRTVEAARRTLMAGFTMQELRSSFQTLQGW